VLTISTITSPSAAELAALHELMRDSVEHGASIGYVLPLAQSLVENFWRGIFADVKAGERIVIVARETGQADAKICATVQLGLCMKPNGRHRAEVQKLMVHSAYRRRGYAVQLMAQVEQVARAQRRSLLVLDTETGSHAERLYKKCGYECAGRIPQYATSPSGEFHATTVFYRVLDNAA
jgi:acetyltransferase